MNETVAERCLQGGFGWESQETFRERPGAVKMLKILSLQTPRCFFTAFQKHKSDDAPSPLQSTYHSTIPHRFQGTVQNVSMAARPGLFWSLFICPGGHNFGLSLPPSATGAWRCRFSSLSPVPTHH